MTNIYYIAKCGNKFLSLDLTTGVSWGKRANAYHFGTAESALQIGAKLSGSRSTVIVEAWEEE